MQKLDFESSTLDQKRAASNIISRSFLNVNSVTVRIKNDVINLFDILCASKIYLNEQRRSTIRIDRRHPLNDSYIRIAYAAIVLVVR